MSPVGMMRTACAALSIFLHCLTSTSGSVDPELLPSGDTHLYQTGESFNFTCRGSASLTWSLPGRDPVLEGELTIEADCEGLVQNHCSHLVIRNLTYRDTGWYTCSYSDPTQDQQSSTYVFVEDQTHPFVDHRHGPHTLFVYTDAHTVTVPCAVTSPNFQVSLDGVPYMSPSTRNATVWDPKVGFRMPFSPYDHYNFLICCISLPGHQYKSLYIPAKKSSELRNVRVSPDRLQLLVGDTLELNCSGETTYNGRIIFTWDEPDVSQHQSREQRRHKGSPSRDYVMSNTLVIRNVTVANSGQYRCTAELLTEKQAAAEVIVYESAFLNVSHKGMAVISALEGEEKLTFELLVTAFPLPTSVRWYKDGVLIMDNATCYEQSGYNLLIKDVKQMHTGIYTAVLGREDKGLFRNISYTLQVTVKPVILEEEVGPADLQPYQLGREYSLTCTAFGVPLPQITWKWQHCDPDPSLTRCNLSSKANHIQVEKAEKAEEENVKASLRQNRIKNIRNSTERVNGREKISSTLTVTAAEVSGWYTCVVWNDVGTRSWGLPFYVDDHTEAIDISPQSAIEGRNVTLVCRATRYLYTDLYWYSPENKTTSLTEGDLQIEQFSILLPLTLTSPSQGGIQASECRALSSYSQQVVHKEVVLNIEARWGPWIQQNLSAQHVNSSSTLTLVCQAQGVPAPLIIWYKDKTPVQQGPGITLTEDGNLTIERVKKDDEGLYECLAANSEGNVTTSAVVTVEGEDGNANMEVAILVCTGAAAGFLWFMLVLIIRKVKKPQLAEFDPSFLSISMPLDDQYDLPPYDAIKWEFPRDRLKLGKTLGHGAFGKVVEAAAFGIDKQSTCKTVAVKMLKGGASANESQALMSELKILIHIGQHLNVVNLLGACTKPGGPLMIIVEFCKYGNLSSHLRSKRPDFTVYKSRERKALSPKPTSDVREVPKRRLESVASTSSSASSGFVEDKSCDSDEDEDEMEDLSRRPLTMEDLICYSFQVAKGMDFLASRKCIHRDLAARNILLSENNVVKICDFGLARDIYKDPDYVRKGDARLPLKWMAPESIFDKVYTPQSDVWSFGVLMWEIFSLGASPYPGLQIDEEFCCKLKDGTRMRAPEYSTPEIYQTMLDCWQSKPEDRPTFTQLVEQLGDLLQANVQQEGKHYIPINTALLSKGTKLLSSIPTENICQEDTDKTWRDNVQCASVRMSAEGIVEKKQDSVHEWAHSGGMVVLSPQSCESLRSAWAHSSLHQPLRTKALGTKTNDFVLHEGEKQASFVALHALNLSLEDSRMDPSLECHRPPPDYNEVIRYSAPPV